MALEIFTQLTATGDQLEQQYKLRKRFCIDHLGWTDRTVVAGMEYDQYDHPAAVYIVWRDDEGVARAMARFTPCHIPYMIYDHWPHLVEDTPIPQKPDQWEVTRFCVERCLGDRFGLVIAEIFAAAEHLAKEAGIKTFWWIGPKDRIQTLMPHNHVYVGPGLQIGDEFCFVGYSDATNMVSPEKRNEIPQIEKYELPAIAA